MVDSIYPTELQVNKANSLDTGFVWSNGTDSTKIYDDKQHDFDSHYLDGAVPWRTSYWVYISQLIRFARASLNVSDFNCRNKALMPNFLGRSIVTIICVRRFRNFIAETVHW